MIDMNNLNVKNRKKINNCSILYSTSDCNYSMVIDRSNPFGKLLHMAFIINYKNSEKQTTRKYGMDKGGMSIPLKHMEIANEMLELFDNMIVVPAHLTGCKYKIYNYYEEFFSKKVN